VQSARELLPKALSVLVSVINLPLARLPGRSLLVVYLTNGTNPYHVYWVTVQMCF